MMKRLAAQAEVLCRAVAPDLARDPLYVVLRSELPPELRIGDGLLGLTTRHLDLILRPTLERLVRWRGRGSAMPIDPTAVVSGSAHRDRPAHRRAFAPAFLGIVVRELAHIGASIQVPWACSVPCGTAVLPPTVGTCPAQPTAAEKSRHSGLDLLGYRLESGCQTPDLMPGGQATL